MDSPRGASLRLSVRSIAMDEARAGSNAADNAAGSPDTRALPLSTPAMDSTTTCRLRRDFSPAIVPSTEKNTTWWSCNYARVTTS